MRVNAFNWFYGPTWPTALHVLGRRHRPCRRGARRLALSRRRSHLGRRDRSEVLPRRHRAAGSPTSSRSWAQLGSDPADTRIAASSGVTPLPSPTPPSAEPGLVALSGSVKLDKGDREVGQRLFYAWFTLTNRRRPAAGPGGHPAGHPRPRGCGAGHGLRRAAHVGRGAVTRGDVLVAAGPGGPLARVDRGQPGPAQASLVGDEQAFGFWVGCPRNRC